MMRHHHAGPFQAQILPRFVAAQATGWRRGLLLMLVLQGTMGCVATRAPRPLTAGQQEILAVTEHFFAAMEARDSTALRALLHPGAQIVSVQGGVQVGPGTLWSAAIGRAPEPLVERIQEPRIEIDGNLASLWAPYTFHIGTRFSHCGHDAFQYVRERGAWRLVSVAFTRQTTGCPGQAR